MMLAYYPGCSLEGTASEYDRSTRAVARSLGVELKELDDWNCCGASSAHCLDEELSVELPARNLRLLEKQENDLLVPCAACYSRLKKAHKELLRSDASSYEGKHHVNFLLDFLSRDDMVEKIRERVERPLKGLDVVCYYGCLTVRPPKVTDVSNYENPTHMDRVVEALGATVRPWSFKTDCCGSGLALARDDLVVRLSARILDMAREAGAEAVVVACPMCHANLDGRQRDMTRTLGREYKVPVYYITELIGLAFRSDEAGSWLGKHLTESTQLLVSKGLL
jgi:heterodisulfide reductase subunit B